MSSFFEEQHIEDFLNESQGSAYTTHSRSISSIYHDDGGGKGGEGKGGGGKGGGGGERGREDRIGLALLLTHMPSLTELTVTMPLDSDDLHNTRSRNSGGMDKRAQTEWIDEFLYQLRLSQTLATTVESDRFPSMRYRDLTSVSIHATEKLFKFIRDARSQLRWRLGRRDGGEGGDGRALFKVFVVWEDAAFNL